MQKLVRPITSQWIRGSDCTSSSKLAQISWAACPILANVANEYPFPKPSGHTAASRQTKIWSLWSVMCFLICCVPSFCPLLPFLHLAELRLGLFAHTQSSRWLTAPQAETERRRRRRWCLYGANGRRGWAKNRPSTTFQTRSCRLQQCQTSQTAGSNSKVKSKWHEARQGAGVHIRPQSLEKRGWNQQRLYKCSGAAAELAWPLALLPKTWPAAAHMSPSGTKRNRGGGWGWNGKGFSWVTEGCLEERSWLPECSLLSSIKTWAHTTIHGCLK